MLVLTVGFGLWVNANSVRVHSVTGTSGGHTLYILLGDKCYIVVDSLRPLSVCVNISQCMWQKCSMEKTISSRLRIVYKMHHIERWQEYTCMQWWLLFGCNGR